MDQLAYKEDVHSLLTMNICFSFIKCEQNEKMDRIEKYKMELSKYKFGVVINPQYDPDKQDPVISKLSSYMVSCHNYSLVEHKIQAKKGFLNEIDIIIGQMNSMGIELVKDRCDKTYEDGWVDPLSPWNQHKVNWRFKGEFRIPLLQIQYRNKERVSSWGETPWGNVSWLHVLVTVSTLILKNPDLPLPS